MGSFTLGMLYLSTALQLVVAILALRLVPGSRAGGSVWLMLALAMLAMLFRRVATLVGVWWPELDPLLKGPIAEGIALTISCLMLAAVVRAPRVFHILETSLAAERQSAAEARDAVGARDDFLSVASHELRTPITSLKLAVQGLASGGWAAKPEATGRAVAIAERQVGRLEALVDHLLNVTRIQSGQLQPQLQREDVDLSELVREIVDRFAADARQAGCELVVHAEAPVVGRWDRLRLEQVVTNLFSNALKFGAGKPVELVVERERNTARLRVTDHGIGIPSDRLPLVFKRFERAVSTREYGGLGLGLHIAQGIVTAHGGTIAVASTVGRGTCFTVELPCA